MSASGAKGSRLPRGAWMVRYTRRLSAVIPSYCPSRWTSIDASHMAVRSGPYTSSPASSNRSTWLRTIGR